MRSRYAVERRTLTICRVYWLDFQSGQVVQAESIEAPDDSGALCKVRTDDREEIVEVWWGIERIWRLQLPDLPPGHAKAIITPCVSGR